MAPCEECGYDYEALSRGEILAVVPDMAAQNRNLLGSVPAERLRAHTRSGSWSPLEYGCHVRDVLIVQRDRVLRAQAQQTPRFESMRRDERALEERYNEQDPVAVGAAIAAAATELTSALASTRGRSPRSGRWSGSAAGRRTSWPIICSTSVGCSVSRPPGHCPPPTG